MVIAGAPEPSPERVAAWSAVVAKPQSEPGKATTATNPPVPPAPKPSTTFSEKPPLLEPASPPVAAAPGSSATAVPQSAATAAAVSSVPAAPTVPQAPHAAPPATVAELPAPVPAGPPAAVPDLPTHASASSPQAASATTGGPAPVVAPAVDPAAPVVPMAPVAPPSRPPSPDRRPSRPHSPAPHQDRESSRRRRNSPRRYQQQGQWHANRGGRGGWRGPRGRGGGGAYDPPVRMADLQRAVTTAVREERAAPTQGSSRAGEAYSARRQPVLPESPLPVAPIPPQIPASSAPAAAAPAPEPGSRLRMPPVPPVAGVEFVAAGGGAAGAHYLPTGVAGSTSHAVQEPFHALLLIQVLAHSSLPVVPPERFQDRHREACLDAADQLAVLLAPVLAAPAEGGVASAGHLMRLSAA
ncbi:unnamed protein product [Closterium sp. Naga37s-1]|nr:unnamed protein product [Closterium sp. Naga37s-1]